MMRKFILFLLALLFCTNTFASEPEISNLIVTNTRDDLLIFLKVENAFNKDIVEEIKSGLPTTFTFFLNLDKVRSLWVNKALTEKELTHTIKWDGIKKEYTITRSWENNKKIKTKSFKEAAKLMTEVDSLKITALKSLEKGALYQLSAKSELRIVRLPLQMQYLLFFVSYWDRETDWHTVEFIY